MMTVNNPVTFPNEPEKPKASSWLLILEVCGLAGLIKIIVTISEVFATLPAQIPVHYAITGEVNGYGSKWLIWLLPTVAALGFAALSLAQRKPDKLRYPVVVTTDNWSRQLHNVKLLFCFIKLYVVSLMLFLTYQTIRNSNDANAFLSPWFLPVSLAVMMLIISVFIYRSYQLK